jgi:hypothetical protein
MIPQFQGQIIPQFQGQMIPHPGWLPFTSNHSLYP